MNNKIFISIDIVKENDIEYFLIYGKFFLLKSIKKTIKQNKNFKIYLFFTIRKEYRKFLLLEISKFKNKNLNIGINLSVNRPNKDSYNAFKHYKKSDYNLFFKISGDTIVDENYFIRFLNYFKQGYTSIFSNLIEIYEEEFKKYHKNNKLNKYNTEKFIYNFLKKNPNLYDFKKISLISKKNFFIIESDIPRLLAFSKNINDKPIFINNFQNLGMIVLKSSLDDGFRTRYKITNKIVSEINNIFLSNNDEIRDKYQLYIKKKPKKDQNTNFVYVKNPKKFLKIAKENIFKNFMPPEDLEIDFLYYKSLYIYYVYSVYKKKFKIPLTFILILSLAPFPLRKLIYFSILKKIYSKSDPFYDHTIDRLLFHQSRNNLNFLLNRFFKKK